MPDFEPSRFWTRMRIAVTFGLTLQKCLAQYFTTTLTRFFPPRKKVMNYGTVFLQRSNKISSFQDLPRKSLNVFQRQKIWICYWPSKWIWKKVVSQEKEYTILQGWYLEVQNSRIKKYSLSIFLTFGVSMTGNRTQDYQNLSMLDTGTLNSNYLKS